MAARRGQAFSGGSIRSGRFSFENKTGAETETTIIDSSSSSIYRFFNTGSDTFEVKSLTTTKRIPVSSKCSIDVNVSRKIAIVVPANATVEGIYNYAESHSGIRSGRFVGDLVKGVNQTMIFGRSGSLYRFFNSGDQPLFIKNGQGPSVPLVKIPVRHSLDMIVQNVVKIGTDSTSSVKIEAIYEYLDSEKSVRSGRFKRTVSNSPANFHQIIDFIGFPTQPVGKYALYRIFNSGENSFDIFARLGVNGQKKIRTLEAEQSIDIGFNSDGFNQNKTIWVKSSANTKPIEGIYEFLGFDDD